MSGDKKIVWILGAGFSRSLGGPLLSGFFTARSREVLKNLYPDVLYSGGVLPNPPDDQDHGKSLWDTDETNFIYELFRHGTMADFGDAIWQDAENFLEFIDAESRRETCTGELWKLCARARGVTAGSAGTMLEPEAFAHVARRLLAAQCCAFLRHNPTTLERWQPYVVWAAQLRDTDTIVSFNYDRVVELATSEAAAKLDGRGLHVFMPESGRLGNLGVGRSGTVPASGP